MAKVLWLCEYPLAGGGDRSLLAALPALRAAGFAPSTIVPEGELAELCRAEGLDVLPWNWFDAGNQRFTQATSRARLADLLKAECPALLHANSLAMARLAGPVANKLQIPSLGHIRDIVGLSAQATVDVNQNDRLLAVSKATQRYHQAQGLDTLRTFVLHNGVDLRRFAPAETKTFKPSLRDELGLPADSLLVACIGQIIRRKGQDLLAPLAQAMRTTFPHACLLIIGDSPSQKAEAKEFTENLRNELHAAAGDRVRFLGRRSDLAEILPQLTLVVHAARQEPLGRVLLEAAAAGLPIVATDAGGTAEIFPAAAQAAVLVPVRESAPLAEAAIQLLNDPQRQAQLGLAARRRAEAAFDALQSGERLARHYAEVVAARAAKR